MIKKEPNILSMNWRSDFRESQMSSFMKINFSNKKINAWPMAKPLKKISNYIPKITN